MTSFSVPMELPRPEAALRDCSSESAEVRWVAAQALSTYGGDDRSSFVEALRGLCADPVEEVRAQAVISLAEQLRRGAEVDHSWIMAAFKDESPAVRTAALDCLAVLPEEALEKAGAMLGDESPGIRANAAEALGDCGATDYADGIAQLLSDEDDWVRCCAATALGRMEDSRGEMALRGMLKEPETAVESALLLGSLGNPENVSALTECGDGLFTSSDLRAACAAARINCGDESGRQVLSKMLQAFRWSVRRAALRALAELPSRGMTEHVAELIDSGRSADASSAIRVLAIFAEAGDNEALVALRSRKESLAGELGDELTEALLELESMSDEGGPI